MTSTPVRTYSRKRVSNTSPPTGISKSQEIPVPSTLSHKRDDSTQESSQCSQELSSQEIIWGDLHDTTAKSFGSNVFDDIDDIKKENDYFSFGPNSAFSSSSCSLLDSSSTLDFSSRRDAKKKRTGQQTRGTSVFDFPSSKNDTDSPAVNRKRTSSTISPKDSSPPIKPSKLDASSDSPETAAKSRTSTSPTKQSRKKTKHIDEAELASILTSTRKSALERSDESDMNELRDDLDYMLEGLAVNKSLAVRKSSAFNLAKLCKQQSSHVGQLLRVDGHFVPLFDLLQHGLEDEVIMWSACAILYFLFNNSLNSEFVTANAVELLLKIAEMPESKKEPVFYENSEARSRSPSPTKQRPSSPVKRRTTSPTKPQPPSPTKGKKKTSDNSARKRDDMLEKAVLLFGPEDVIFDLLAQSVCIQTLSVLLGVVGFQHTDMVKERLLNNLLQDILNTVHVDMRMLKKRGTTQGFIGFKCKQIHRYFGIMEVLTFMNRDNQTKMLDYNNCEIVSSIFDLTHLYKDLVEKLKTKENLVPLYDCLLSGLKVLVNLTNESDKSITSVKLSDCAMLMKLLCEVMENIIPASYQFDIKIVVLSLLTNLVETTDEMKVMFRNVDMKTISDKHEGSAVSYLTSLFVQQTQDETKSAKKLETEHNIALSYLAIVLGILQQDGLNKSLILKELPNQSFTEMRSIIAEFIAYQFEAGILSKETHASFLKIIQSMKQESDGSESQPNSAESEIVDIET